MTDYLKAWGISLADYETGGWGSTLGGKFLVPKFVERGWTINGVYQKEAAFNSIATVFIEHVRYLYQTILNKVDLGERGVISPVSIRITEPYNINGIEVVVFEATFRSALDMLLARKAKILTVEGSTNQFSSFVEFLGQLPFDTKTFKAQFVATAPTLDESLPIYFHDDSFYAYLEHTREGVKKAIYKGIELATINREFFSLIKDNTIQGQNFSWGSQLSQRVAAYEFFIREAKVYLDNANLGSYSVEVDYTTGQKALFYNNALISYGDTMNYSNANVGAGVIDGDKILEAERLFATGSSGGTDDGVVDDQGIKEAEALFEGDFVDDTSLRVLEGQFEN